VVQLFLGLDRREMLEQLGRVLLTFAMPAVHLLADSRRRAEDIRKLGIFNEEVFLHDLYQPIVEALGVGHRELRDGRRPRKSAPAAAEVPR
jgi:hypothetical protein